MKKSKILSIILSLFILLCFSGCGETPVTPTIDIPTSTVTPLPTSTASAEPTQTSTTEPSPLATPFATDEPTPIVTVEPTPTATPAFSDQLEIHFIDVGQADAILIKQGTHSMLVDAGNNADSDMVVTYIENEGISDINYLIGTHPHEDHIGGLDQVIKTFSIDKIIMPKVTSTTKTFEDVLTVIKQKGLKVTTPIPGTTYNFGEAEFTILAPNGSSYDDTNNYSIVIKLVFGQTSFLLTGDAEDVSESEMLSKDFDLKADVLKVGHHGSTSSCTDAFLTAVDPLFAIISVGLNNDYQHPAPSTVKRLNDHGINIYRTDENGTIIAATDGKNISFSFKQNDSAPQKNNEQVTTPSPSPTTTPIPTPSLSPTPSPTPKATPTPTPTPSPTPSPKQTPTPTPKPTPSPTPTPSASQPTKGEVVIQKVDLQGEIVTLKNTSSIDIDISSWTLLSVKGEQKYIFPAGTVIKAGAILTIASGDASGDIKWTTKNIWNNDGDPAELIDSSGTIVSKK